MNWFLAKYLHEGIDTAVLVYKNSARKCYVDLFFINYKYTVKQSTFNSSNLKFVMKTDEKYF